MSDVRPEGEGELLPELVGTWRVTRFDDRDSEDLPWEPLLPPHGDGVVVYDEQGLWAVQIYAAARDGEKAFYVGYYGRGSVHDVVREDGVVRGNLVVDVEGASSQDNLEYADRPIEITADRVVIGDQRTWIREAVRLR